MQVAFLRSKKSGILKIKEKWTPSAFIKKKKKLYREIVSSYHGVKKIVSHHVRGSVTLVHWKCLLL